MKRVTLLWTALLLVVAGAAGAAHGGLVVTPARVETSRVVHVSATASPCLVGDDVTVISRAFVGHAFGGEGAASGPVRAHGAFVVSARIRASLAPGRYEVTARCGGGNLPDAGFFRVVRPRTTSLTVYLVRNESVAPVRRVILSAPTVARSAIGRLLQGPTTTERRRGYSSAIPEGTRLRGVALNRGVLAVDLTRSFESGGGSLSMLLRVAQVVYTATQFPTIERVAFRLDGEPVDTIGGEGVVVAPPVDRTDFEAQAPRILVEQPLPGDRVSSPLLVRGTANVFEAQFLVDVARPDGTILTHRTVSANAGNGSRGSFALRIPVTTKLVRLVIVAYDRSPKNGARIDVVRIPVTLR